MRFKFKMLTIKQVVSQIRSEETLAVVAQDHRVFEMQAVFQALKHFLPDLRGHHVLVRTDNTSVVSYINSLNQSFETESKVWFLNAY